MKPKIYRALAIALVCMLSAATNAAEEDEGPASALEFELRFRGEACAPDKANCYPEAKGIPFSATPHIVPMSASLWRPSELVADFQRRAKTQPVELRKKGIIVVLKTERCATKEARLCSVTTAALEKRSTPLLREFEIYGLQIKPRDKDDPPGSLLIETGEDAWKNDAVREYGFKQGPGATIVFLNPETGAKLVSTDALKLRLYERAFLAHRGRTPELETLLVDVLLMIGTPKS